MKTDQATPRPLANNIANWYAIYTHPRAEKKVRERLEEAGVECYLPMHRGPRVWSDRVKIVDLPLFNSYIFVRSAEINLFPLLRINGIVRIIFFNGKPAVISQKEIDIIKDFIIRTEGMQLCTGDEVEILTGAMKKLSGKILNIGKKYIYLRMECLNATVCVKADCVASTKRIK